MVNRSDLPACQNRTRASLSAQGIFANTTKARSPSTVFHQAPCATSSHSLVIFILLVVTITFFLPGCGGGGSTTPINPSPISRADFALSVSPQSVVVQDGSSSSVSVLATPTNGFSSPVSVTVSGLPQGITVSPTIVNLTPGVSQDITFTAHPSAPVSEATVAIVGTGNSTGNSLTRSTQIALRNSANVVSNTTSFRTRYVRTDAATPYFAWRNSQWVVYNPPTSRFFVVDPSSNRIFALDARTESLAGTIYVPGAFSIDDTPDHLTLYAGTQVGDVYEIDPVNMAVVKRYGSSGFGSSGFKAYSALVMADGRLALLGGQGGIPQVDGYAGFALWNPADNSLDVYATDYGAGQIGLPHTVTCGSSMGNISNFLRSPDRRTLLMTSAFSDGTICEFDVISGTSNSLPRGGFIWHIVYTPDGSRIVMTTPPAPYNQVEVRDAQTLSQVAAFAVADASSATALFVSADSRTLYSSSDSVVYAYDIVTGKSIGWLPNLVVEATSSGSAIGPITGPHFQAMDETGLLAGPMEQGFGFLDTTALRPQPVGTQFLNGYLTPATGPTGGGTQIGWNSAPLSDVYFGSLKAFSVSTSGSAVSAVTPPGAPGPADLYALASDGGMQVLPEAFSYGPAIIQAVPDTTTVAGGIGILFGYGLGPVSTRTIPPDLQVAIGGRSAAVLGFDGQLFGLAPPYLLQAVSFIIPAGSAGAADVTVTSSSGTATLPGGMTYLPAVKQFPARGYLKQGVYDPLRDVYYFTDLSAVRVFSLSTESWLPPIAIPGAQRLWGIALSPDGSRLALTDAKNATIYYFSPDQPATIHSFSVPTQISGVDREPVGIAVTNSGVVYFTATNLGCSGCSGYFKLDTATGQLTDYHISSFGGFNERTVLSTDGKRVYFSYAGAPFFIDTTTDQVVYSRTGPGCCYGDDELSISSDNKFVASTGYFYDSDYNAESFMGMNLRESMYLSYLYGGKLSPDGQLYFQPTSLGIDVMDARLGILLNRIALHVPLASTYDALVSNGKDNVLIAITGNDGDGIIILDLNTAAQPAPLPYVLDPGAETAGHLIKSTKPLEAVRDARKSYPGLRYHPGRRPIAVPHKNSKPAITLPLSLKVD